MEMVLELGLQGLDALKRKERYFLAENLMIKGPGVGKHNPAPHSMKSYFSLVRRHSKCGFQLLVLWLRAKTF